MKITKEKLNRIIKEEIQVLLHEVKSPASVYKASQAASGDSGATLSRSTIRHAEWQYSAALIMSGHLKGSGRNPGPDMSFWSSDFKWQPRWKLEKHGLPWGRANKLQIDNEDLPGSATDQEIDSAMSALASATKKGEEAVQALKPKMAPLVKKIMASVEKINQSIQGDVAAVAKANKERVGMKGGIEYSSPDGMFDKPSSRGGRYQPGYTARGTYQFAEGLKITKEKLNKIIKEEIEAALDEGGRGFFGRMFGRPNKEYQKYLEWWEETIDNLHIKFDELKQSQSTDGEAYAKILRAIIKARREFNNNTMIEPYDPNVPGSGDWHTGNDDQKADRKRIRELGRELYDKIAKSKDVAYEVRQAAEEARRQEEEEEQRQARASSGSGGWDSSTAERQCRDEHRSDLRRGYDEGYRKCVERAREFARDQGRRE